MPRPDNWHFLMGKCFVKIFWPGLIVLPTPELTGYNCGIGSVTAAPHTLETLWFLESQKECTWQDSACLQRRRAADPFQSARQEEISTVAWGECWLWHMFSKAARCKSWIKIRFSCLIFSSEVVFRMTQFVAVPSICGHLLMVLGDAFCKNRC